MNRKEISISLIAGGIGVILGGTLIAVATNAIPKMMEEVSATMMGKMMKRMGEESCTADEL